MDERGLTAYIVTLHTPLLVLASSFAAIVAIVAFVAMRSRAPAVRAWIALLWFVGVVVVAYAGGARLLNVRGFDAESISLFP